MDLGCLLLGTLGVSLRDHDPSTGVAPHHRSPTGAANVLCMEFRAALRAEERRTGRHHLFPDLRLLLERVRDWGGSGCVIRHRRSSFLSPRTTSQRTEGQRNLTEHPSPF